MSKKSVLCIATSWNRAEQIIANLRTAHFASKDLSVVFADRSILGQSGAEKDTQTCQWSVASATEGGVDDVALAWPCGLGTLIFAGVGHFTAAGPLLVALGGVHIGGTDGGMAASLIRLGVPVFEAQQYESRMKNGNILLAAYIGDPGDLRRAKGILSESYGENICIVDLVPPKGVLSAQPAPLQG